jgi:ribosomal protein S10
LDQKSGFFYPYLSDLTHSEIMPAKKDQSPKLRIKLKSYDVRMLEASVGKVISLLIKSGAEVK